MTSILNLGPEGQVNTYTTDQQRASQMTVLSDGSYVIVWESYGQDDTNPYSGSPYGIYAQRFSAAGVKLGAETLVNHDVVSTQSMPHVTALTGGGYVVVWDTKYGLDGSSFGIDMQAYSNNGVKIGVETRVNTTTANDQIIPSISALADGSFVVCWESKVQDYTDTYGVYLQHFNAAGAPIGGELRANTTVIGNQTEGVIAGLNDNGWVVAWTSEDQDGSGTGIYAQRYSSNGAKSGTEFRVNTTTTYNQSEAAIAVLADGTYIITWSNETVAGTTDIYMQRFNTAPLTFHNYGAETLVNTTTDHTQGNASIAALSDGGYVIAWESYGQDNPADAWTGGVYLQRYDALGHALGNETLVNTTTAASQAEPSVVATSGGGFRISWTSIDQDGSMAGVFHRDYGPAASLAGGQQVIGTFGDDVMDGGTGGDLMWGGYGNDTYTIDNFFDIAFEKANEGTDVVWSSVDHTLEANVENMLLTAAVTGTGNALDNVITGNSGFNTLIGLDGNDTLDGGTGLDNLFGGPGNDTYALDDAGDVASEETIAGTDDGGTDTVRVGFSYTLGAHIENLVLMGAGNVDGTGNELNNTVTGNSGNNNLNGGTGADSLIGGDGNDVYYVDDTTDLVVEAPGGGTDTVISSLAFYQLTANVENLVLAGTGNLQGEGNSLDNVLTGNSGNNALDGDIGADIMDGGAGDDAYTVDNAGDLVVEAAGNGTDFVNSYVTYNMAGADTEFLTLMGTDALNGYGNYLGNHIYGNSGSNTLTGGGGDDFLDGGLGTDTMLGGAGNDVFTVDNAGDIVTEYVGEGLDAVGSLISYSLSNNVENLILVGTGSNLTGTGNALDNFIASYTGGNDTLDGGAGVDILSGGLGNDTYIIDNAGDVVVENAGEGTDTVQTTLNYVLGVNIENLTLTGASNRNGNGNALDNVLIGNTGNNILKGLDGNDTLDGGIGTDSLYGGLGNDTFIVDNAGDVVVESAGQGIDTVRTALSYVLVANVENLTLTGSGSVNGTGNGLDNILIGNSGVNLLNGGTGNDTLDGGAGVDTLTGGLGNDTFIVDNAGDVVAENAGEGTDTVQTTLNYVLGANLENLTLTGALNRNGNGNALDNVLTGNTGNNILKGLDGNDTVNGGAGSDSLYGGLGADTFLFGSGSGSDTVADFSAAQNDMFNVNAYTHGTAFGGGTTITSDGLGNTIINLGGGNIVTVMGASVSNVTAHMVW